jgi:hypothetical protein
VNHLNQRKSSSAPLVSKEIETDFFRRRFSQRSRKFPETSRGIWGGCESWGRGGAEQKSSKETDDEEQRDEPKEKSATLLFSLHHKRVRVVLRENGASAECSGG